jgi:hypothetical protein
VAYVSLIQPSCNVFLTSKQSLTRSFQAVRVLPAACQPLADRVCLSAVCVSHLNQSVEPNEFSLSSQPVAVFAHLISVRSCIFMLRCCSTYAGCPAAMLLETVVTYTST